jgi:hypothetical protein
LEKNTVEILDKVKNTNKKVFIELETGKEVEHLDQKWIKIEIKIFLFL